MEPINDFFSLLSSFLWGWPMIVLLLGTHLFLTFRLRIPQRKLFTGIKLSIQKDAKAEGDVSQFGALATALAATIGTGNIVGVATAVALGGPGAVLWCWLTGIFGMSTKYAEGLLAVKYRVKTADGRMLGGPIGTRLGYEVVGRSVCHLYRFGFVWYRLYGAGQLDSLAGTRNIRHTHLDYWSNGMFPYRSGYLRRRNGHCQCVHSTGAFHGGALRIRLYHHTLY